MNHAHKRSRPQEQLKVEGLVEVDLKSLLISLGFSENQKSVQ